MSTNGKMTRSEAGKLGAEASREYRHRMKNERIQKYLENPTKCTHCDEPLSYDKRAYKFCNRSCSVSYNNVKRKISSPKRHCMNCERIITNDKFCSNACQGTYAWKQTKIIIENTGMFGDADYTARKNARRYIIEHNGNICDICKTEEWMGTPIPLIADHIDGNSDNNFINNFRMICPNCDALLPTYKGRNKGNGKRIYRRKQK